jgi:hypothetical protein
MSDYNLISIVIAIVGAFIISGIWYAILGDKMTALQKNKNAASDTMGPKLIAIEQVRNIVVVLIMAFLLRQLGSDTWTEGLQYGLLFWTAFPVVLLAGSVVHEGVHPKLAAIHAGDWLLKLVFVAVVLSA